MKINNLLISLSAAIKANYKPLVALILLLVAISVQMVSAARESQFADSEELHDAVTLTAETSLAPKQEVVKIRATAYNADAAQTDDTPDIMASGKKVYPGAIACPRRYPFGTKVTIKGKTYTCEDRMNLRFDASFGNSKDERFDILMATRKEAINWGIRHVDATITVYES